MVEYRCSRLLVSFIVCITGFSCVSQEPAGPPGHSPNSSAVHIVRMPVIPVQAEKQPVPDIQLYPESHSDHAQAAESQAAAENNTSAQQPEATVPETADEAVSKTPAQNAPSYTRSQTDETKPQQQNQLLKAPDDALACRVGDEVTISFSGSAWTFLGVSPDPQAVVLTARDYDGSRSFFTLKPMKLGVHTAGFHHQDSSNGVVVTERLTFNVLTDEMLKSQKQQSTGDTRPGDYYQADSLYRDGQYKKSLQAYLAAYKPGVPEVDARIAELYGLLGEHAYARRYWSRVLSEKSAIADNFHQKAVSGYMNSSVKLGDTAAASKYIDEYVAMETPPPRDSFFKLAKLLAGNGGGQDAEKVLSRYEYWYGNNGIDKTWFMLAGILEGPSAPHDIKRARTYYKLIRENFPLSRYFDEAGSKLEYIDRFYFDIK